jgi:hypothetical protein
MSQAARFRRMSPNGISWSSPDWRATNGFSDTTDLTASPPRWPSALSLWTGLLVGPLAWAGNLVLSYALVRGSCLPEREQMLHLVVLVSLAVIAGAATLSARAFQRTAPDFATNWWASRQRAHLMATLGLMSSALFASAIVAGAIPLWVLEACW